MRAILAVVVAFAVGVWVGPTFPEIPKFPELPKRPEAPSSRYRLSSFQVGATPGAWVLDTHTGEARLWVMVSGKEAGMLRVVLPFRGRTRAWSETPLGEEVP